MVSIASIALKNASLYEKMFREARIDSLTGVYNYKSFVEMLGEQFTACREDCISWMYVDMDNFRLYNQLYGVAAGDRALQETAGAISRAVGEAGLVFRTSGKVFAVLLPHKDTREAEVMAAEIRSRLAAVGCSEDGRRKPLTASVGICTAPYAASTGKELMDNADLAVYNAKKKGKDTVLVFRGGGLPKELSERTHAIVDQIQRSGDSDYRNAMSMISALTAAIDAKDHYTFNHSKNVAEYAATLAVGAGLNEGQVRMIYIAGLLHDIGKISVPEDILNKQGKLTQEEYGVMQGHVNNSIEMIRHLPQMDYVIPAAIGHHERWDGKGYPRGIAQEEIPVGARCLAIADVFDAMTTTGPIARCRWSMPSSRSRAARAPSLTPPWRRCSCSWCAVWLCRCGARGPRSAEKREKTSAIWQTSFLASGPGEELFSHPQAVKQGQHLQGPVCKEKDQVAHGQGGREHGSGQSSEGLHHLAQGKDMEQQPVEQQNGGVEHQKLAEKPQDAGPQPLQARPQHRVVAKEEV